MATRKVRRFLNLVCERNIWPELFTKSISLSLAASSSRSERGIPAGFHRKQTTLNGTGASRSKSGCASIHDASSCASRMWSASRALKARAPYDRRIIQSFSDRQQAGGAIFRDRRAEGRGPHLITVVAGDLAQRFVTEPDGDDRFVDRRVRLIRAVHARTRDIVAAGKPLFTHARDCDLARGHNRVQGGNRRGVVDDTFERIGQSDQPAQPSARDGFELRRRR